ncbi:hypothetical protein Ocin01_00035 [Orchesella cincta]|uniref:Uncharacterized protein n=1 Tax=Orchesella cincta TaxID=48709 RepID=A0A1D2NNK8_ORCCI|nr:hypothetical protein Ocin01_00035 [Orchesella cincta]
MESVSDPCAENGKTLHRLGKTRFYVLHDPKNRKYKFTFKEGSKRCRTYGMRLARIEKLTTDAMVSRLLEGLLQKHKWADTWYWIDAQYNTKLNIYTHQDESVPLNGFGTSWDERYCGNSDKRRVLCESENPKCDYKSDNVETFTDSEVNEKYLTEGNFVFSDRRFIVNWKPRTYDEAEAHCRSIGLELHVSQKEDKCLIAYLKLWAQSITMYQFWTPLNYVAGYGFYTKDVDTVELNENEGRSTKLDKNFCVASVYSYEYSNQTACEGKCTWNSFSLAPANCLNPIGTICRHEDYYDRECIWKQAYTDDKMKAVEETAQTFGNRVCGSDKREMINSQWKLPSSFYVTFEYDMQETYWVVDENEFANAGDPNKLCTVATFEKVRSSYRMTTKKVSCTEWHFYLCREKSK